MSESGWTPYEPIGDGSLSLDGLPAKVLGWLAMMAIIGVVILAVENPEWAAAIAGIGGLLALTIYAFKRPAKVLRGAVYLRVTQAPGDKFSFPNLEQLAQSLSDGPMASSENDAETVVEVELSTQDGPVFMRTARFGPTGALRTWTGVATVRIYDPREGRYLLEKSFQGAGPGHDRLLVGNGEGTFPIEEVSSWLASFSRVLSAGSSFDGFSGKGPDVSGDTMPVE